MHWKIASNPLYKGFSLEQVYDSGFFFDDNDQSYDFFNVTAKSTPIDFIKSQKAKNPAILLLTGCFARFHSGHLEAISAARQRLLDAGYDKVFGYIAPAHDSYIQTKTNRWKVDERVREILKQIKGIDWLKIDYWPAFFNKCDTNFSEIYLHLEEYINRYVGAIPIFYVCGADNANFALTFKNEGNCVIVNRPKYESKFWRYEYLIDNKRIFAAQLNNSESSTKIRALEVNYSDSSKKDLILRVDERYPSEFEVAKKLFPFYNSIQMASVQEQQQKFNKLAGPVISLDPCIIGTFNLGISRLYDYMGVDKIGYVARPEGLSLKKQIKKIPAGRYILYDDDVCSGGTMEFVEQLLSEYGIDIVKEVSFTKSADKEILDARDFLTGSKFGGLVIKEGEKYVRRPYVLPYVLPSVRASVLNSQEFSESLTFL